MSTATLYAMARTDRKLYTEDVATLLGVSPQTVRTYKAPGRGPKVNAFPAPDGVDIECGHARPWWFESRVRAWDEARTGSPGRPRNAG